MDYIGLAIMLLAAGLFSGVHVIVVLFDSPGNTDRESCLRWNLLIAVISLAAFAVTALTALS